ncbi:n-ethylmaleimide sensitive fusion protein, partial [Genlisea aurea]
MIVTNTPGKDLAYTNFAYCSPSDLRNFILPRTRIAYVSIGDVFVLSVDGNDSIPNGHIAFNAIHRRHARVSPGDSVSVSRFVPPENFNLTLLTLELEFIKRGAKEEQVDAVLLSQQIRSRFGNQ